MLHVTVTPADKTEADLKKGPICAVCPVAQAITRELPAGYSASVAYADIWIVRMGEHDNDVIIVAKVPTPYAAHDIINRYDAGILKDEDLPVSFDFDYTPPEV